MIIISYLFKDGKSSQESPLFLTFSGGEEHVQLENIYPEDKIYRDISVVARIKDSKDFMRLVLTLNALKNAYKNTPISLSIPYLPYARQDRVCSPGQAFSLELVANILNSFNLCTVSVVDVHNLEVAKKLIKNLYNTIPVHLMRSIIMKGPVGTIVCPDEGAKNRVAQYSTQMKKYNYCLQQIDVTKKRNPETGKIEEITVPIVNVKDHNCLIVDDICDGGGTFIPIAQQLKEQGANSVSLYITHGIFSKGIDHLTENGIDMIYTTNSFCDIVKHPNLEILQRYI